MFGGSLSLKIHEREHSSSFLSCTLHRPRAHVPNGQKNSLAMGANSRSRASFIGAWGHWASYEASALAWAPGWISRQFYQVPLSRPDLISNLIIKCLGWFKLTLLWSMASMRTNILRLGFPGLATWVPNVLRRRRVFGAILPSPDPSEFFQGVVAAAVRRMS